MFLPTPPSEMTQDELMIRRELRGCFPQDWVENVLFVWNGEVCEFQTPVVSLSHDSLLKLQIACNYSPTLNRLVALAATQPQRSAGYPASYSSQPTDGEVVEFDPIPGEGASPYSGAVEMFSAAVDNFRRLTGGR